MFYEKIQKLCDAHGLTVTGLVVKAGLSRATATKWKKKYDKGEDVTPDRNTIDKLCATFHCDETWLRGLKDESAHPFHQIPTTAEIKFALFGGDKEITDEMYNEVVRFAQYVKNRG